jgi:hypothetical protein
MSRVAKQFAKGETAQEKIFKPFPKKRKGK